MDFASIVIDQITLEGLDGITLSALWIRLSNCKQTFPLKLDPESKQYLWSAVITPHKELRFYALKEPRPPLVLNNRYTAADNENDIMQEPPEPPNEIYPYMLVNEDNVLGSCTTYHTRQDITEEIRPADGNTPSLEEMFNKYGECLVVVASQVLRTRILLNNESDQGIDLGDRVYCLLERLGRARHYGETTHGNASLRVWMHENCKFVFYMKKKLTRFGLITSQLFTMRNAKGQNLSGKLIHLKKFFVEVKPLSLLLMEKLTRKLAERPNKMEVLTVIRAEMGVPENSFKKLYMWGSKYVKAELHFSKDIFPDAEESLHYHKGKKKLRQVRVLRLLKVYTYSVDGQDDDDEEEEEAGGTVGGDEADDDLDDISDSVEGIVPHLFELPLLNQVYHVIEARGELGMSQREVGQAFKLPRLESRMICRSLERLNSVHKIMRDVGKQREQRFVAQTLVHKSTMHKELMEERHKILIHHRTNKEIKAEMEDKADSVPVSDLAPHEESEIIQQESPTNVAKEELPSFTEAIICMDEVKNCYHNQARKNPHVTLRMLKRANMVLDAIKQAKVIENVLIMQKRIMEEEEREGLQGRMDKKSLVRLIKRLEKDGQLKIFKSSKRINEENREVVLVCDISMTPENALVKNTIESAFNRMIAFNRESRNKLMKGLTIDSEMINAARPNHALLKSDYKVSDMQFQGDAGRRYGYLPRMKRYQTTHEFLWYIVHGYGKPMYTPGGDSLLQDDDPMPIDSELKSANLPFTVYSGEASFRRFLPPLPEHTDYGDGWFLVGDILLLLPLTIFLQVIRFNFKSSEIEQYLADPILKWLLVCYLPTHLRMMLMFERRYIFQFSDILQQMSHMGLLSIGMRDFKEKEQIFMYIHKNASIIDTTIPKLTTEGRPVKHFYFDKAHTVRDYWFSMQWICTNTALANITRGRSDELMGKSLKLERFNEASSGKTPKMIKDNGNIPGNKKGAGGLDSYFFSHRRRNWTLAEARTPEINKRLMPKQQGAELQYINKLKQSALKENPPREGMDGVKEMGDLQSSVKETTVKNPVRKMKKKPTKSSVTDNEKPEASTKQAKKTRAKKIAKTASGEEVQTITMKGAKARRGGKGMKRKKKALVPKDAPEKKKRRMIPKQLSDELDDLDRTAMSRMTRERSDWSSREDSLLLLWRVCLVFLCGWRRDSVVPYSTIRDYLHSELPESFNKTTVACKRRLFNMLKNPETINHINMYVGEALQDKKLVDEFRTNKTYRRVFTEVDVRIEIFKNCYKKLRAKFMTGHQMPSLDLPNSIKEIEEKYVFNKPTSQGLLEHKEPQCHEDVHFTVLHNVIHSAILLDDKTCRAHELYQLFSQYPESLVNNVFTSMKNDSIVTKIKKGTARGKSKLNILPAVGMGTYMLTQKYTYFWITKYPRLVFYHAYEAYNPMVQLCAESSSVSKWIQVEGIAGYAAMLIALMAGRKLVFETTIPENIVTLDYSRSKKVKKNVKETKTESDEEEEAMINEAERVRAEQTGKASSTVSSTSPATVSTNVTTGDQKIPIGDQKTESSVVKGFMNTATPAGSGESVTVPTSKKILPTIDNDVVENNPSVASETVTSGTVTSGTSGTSGTATSETAICETVTSETEASKTVTSEDVTPEAVVSESVTSARVRRELLTDGSSVVMSAATADTADPSSVIINTTKPKGSLSRTAISLFHSQYIHSVGSIRYLDPLDHLVVNSCTVRAKLKKMEIAKPKLHWAFDFEAQEYIMNWNKNNTDIHSKTAFNMFKRLRVLLPTKRDLDITLNDLENNDQYTLEEVQLMHKMHDLIVVNQFLGLTVHELKAQLMDHSNYDRCLNILLEIRIMNSCLRHKQ